MAHVYVQVPTGRLVQCPTPSCPSISTIPVLKRHVRNVHAPATVRFVCRECPFQADDARVSTGHLKKTHKLANEDETLELTRASWSLADVASAAPGEEAAHQPPVPCGLPAASLQAPSPSPPPTPFAGPPVPAVSCGLPDASLQAPGPPPSRSPATEVPVPVVSCGLPTPGLQAQAPSPTPVPPSSPSPPKGPLLRTPASTAAVGTRLLRAGQTCRRRTPPALWRTPVRRFPLPNSPPQIVAAAAVCRATQPSGRPWEEAAAEIAALTSCSTPSSPWDPLACHDPGAVARALGVRAPATMPSGGAAALATPGMAMLHSADAAPRQVAPVSTTSPDVKASLLPSSHLTGTTSASGPSALEPGLLLPAVSRGSPDQRPWRTFTPPLVADFTVSAATSPASPSAPVRYTPDPSRKPASLKDLFACILSARSNSPQAHRANAFQRRWIRKLQEAQDWPAIEQAVEELTVDLTPPNTNRGSRAQGRGRGRSRRQPNAARRLQFLYKVNKKKAMREVRDEGSPLCSLPTDEVESFFEQVFSARLPQLDDPPEAVVLPATQAEDPGLVSHFSPEVIAERLRRCANTAPGLDGVPYASLKRKDAGCHILSEVFRLCMQYKRIPASWKKAKTILIYKKGDASDLSNWRPIALSSCLYKLYTSVLADRLSAWGLRTGALSSIQKGFVPAEGCLEHNFLLQQCLDFARESGAELCVSWLDLKNAFGSVPHSAIFKLLRQHGVHSHFIDIVEEAYSGSTTTIITASGETKPVPMASGVKQGDPLSPIIFNLFIEVLLRSIQAISPLHGFQLFGRTLSCLAFADDIVILSNSSEAAQQMLNVAGEVASWVGLQFNAKKCATLSVSKRRSQTVHTTVQGQPIPSLRQEEAYQHLGVPTGLYVNQTPESTIEQMLKDLHCVECSLLTDWQKLDAIRTFILPQATFALQTSRIQKTCFTKLDQEIKRIVKKALHLPARASNEIIFLPTQKGGANIMPLSELADVGAVNKAFKVLTSPDVVVREIAKASLKRAASRVMRNTNNDGLAAYLSGETLDSSSNSFATIWSAARNAARRICSKIPGFNWGWSDDLQRFSVHIPVPGKTPNIFIVDASSRDQLYRRIRQGLQHKHLLNLIAK
ncbi:Retrovirus-related Pol polyprotein from type-2 retrotransposable element R2DM, partial [Frankliniella fusca]